MTRQQLIDFIVKHGEDRKKEAFDNAVRITEDAEQTKIAQLLDSLRAGVEAKQQKVI